MNFSIIINRKMDQSIIDDIMTRAQELVANNDKNGLKRMLACFDKLYYQL